MTRARLRRLLRPICALVGHRQAFWMLPEFFGLYRYSRSFCSRCELTFEWCPPSHAEQTAFWLAEVARLTEADSPLGHGTPVPEEAELPSGDARIEAQHD